MERDRESSDHKCASFGLPQLSPSSVRRLLTPVPAGNLCLASFFPHFSKQQEKKQTRRFSKAGHACTRVSSVRAETPDEERGGKGVTPDRSHQRNVACMCDMRHPNRLLAKGRLTQRRQTQEHTVHGNRKQRDGCLFSFSVCVFLSSASVCQRTHVHTPPPSLSLCLFLESADYLTDRASETGKRSETTGAITLARQPRSSFPSLALLLLLLLRVYACVHVCDCHHRLLPSRHTRTHTQHELLRPIGILRTHSLAFSVSPSFLCGLMITCT